MNPKFGMMGDVLMHISLVYGQYHMDNKEMTLGILN